MPLHDYKCPNCGSVEEKFLRSTNVVEVLCVNCDIVMHKLPPLIAKTASIWNDRLERWVRGTGISFSSTR
jgi:predicted nucleic acid-binding Zn ribbon protein